MASSPDGLISAQYAVITKTPGWEVLTRGRGGAPVAGVSSHTLRHPVRPQCVAGCYMTLMMLPPFPRKKGNAMPAVRT